MKKVFILILLLLLLMACGTPKVEENSTVKNVKDIEEKNIVTVISTEKVTPSDFAETGFTREETPYLTYLIKQATEQEEFNEMWGYFNFQKEPPSIDFIENNVVFFSLEESGSCALELDGGDVQVNPDRESLEIEITGPNEVCSTDATPRTFVLKVSKEANIIRNVEISEYGINTIIPMN